MLSILLGLLAAEDVGVTGVKNGHGGATEELTAGGTELDLHEGKEGWKSQLKLCTLQREQVSPSLGWRGLAKRAQCK